MMKRLALGLAVSGVVALGCGAGSGEYLRQEQYHEAKTQQDAANGQYGAAQDEQRKAEDSRHDAVKAEINEGRPMPQSAPPPGYAP